VRDTVERARKLEMKRQQQQLLQQQQQQHGVPAAKPSRRATTAVIPVDLENDVFPLKRSLSGEKANAKKSHQIDCELESSHNPNSVPELEISRKPEPDVEPEVDSGRPAFLADIANFGAKNRRRSNFT
jgi:hypothetical protein